tara:strand:- start:1196 stop:1675 length:480 start_codon:yes stop_codon:yes gene_type:complete
MNVISLISKAELALASGDYRLCIEILETIQSKVDVNTKQGEKIRIIIITALMGQGDDEKATELCRSLTKATDPEIRMQAKQLISILEAPSLPRPESWSLKIPKIDVESDSFQTKIKGSNLPKRKEDLIYPPTGSTKAFQSGFFILTMIFFLSFTLLINP